MKKRLLLLLMLLGLFAGCKHGPELTICLINSKDNALECSDASGKAFTLPLPDADNYVCMSPEEFKTLLDWMRSRCDN